MARNFPIYRIAVPDKREHRFNIKDLPHVDINQLYFNYKDIAPVLAEEKILQSATANQQTQPAISLDTVENVLLTYADDRAYLKSGSEWVDGIMRQLRLEAKQQAGA